MLAKSKLTAFSTKNIDVSPLTHETCNCSVQKKIFINELVNKKRFLWFNYFKSIVRGLGFKYVWHRSGRFLVMRQNDEETQVFTTAAVLHALSNLYKDSDGGADTPVRSGSNAKDAANVKSPAATFSASPPDASIKN